jgi:outer membrane protein OmpA-like peptidoglycan-associated protein
MALVSIVLLTAGAWTQSDDDSALQVVVAGPEADLVVRTGDIDNLGFGWPEGFDPFRGLPTPVHAFPWEPSGQDPAGTDRIMIVSGYQSGFVADGYSTSVELDSSRPVPVVLRFDVAMPAPREVWLQLFLDDFQPRHFGGSYRVSIDGERIPALEDAVNALAQTGPIGKLLTVRLQSAYWDLIADGTAAVLLDDPTNDIGDGFAIDFVRLLVNPRSMPEREGILTGTVVDSRSGEPVPFATVRTGTQEVRTDAEGRFRMPGQPAGLTPVRASAPGFSEAADAVDLPAGETRDLRLEVDPRNDEARAIAEDLDRHGRAQLPGIYFDSDSDVLRPESEETLRAVAEVMRARPDERFVIEGHTDAQASEEHNQELSYRRASAVRQWLLDTGIEAGRLESRGFGESVPVADNGSEAGRALNRRVEIVAS